jgi:hypothetical protein
MKLIDILTEETKATTLAPKINSAIKSVDNNMSYKDFAKAVAIVLRDEYGTHNYNKFMDTLKNNLVIEK